MKEIVVKIEDDAYYRAESLAQARKISVSDLVEELVESMTETAHPNSDDVATLFAALDKGLNTEPIVPVSRNHDDLEHIKELALSLTPKETTLV